MLLLAQRSPQLLQHSGEFSLDKQLDDEVLVGISFERHLSGALHWSKEANIQGVHFVDKIWGKAEELNVLLPTYMVYITYCR